MLIPFLCWGILFGFHTLASDITQVLMLGLTETDGGGVAEGEICQTIVSTTEPGPPGTDWLLISGATKSKYIIAGFNSSIHGCHDNLIPFILKYTESG